MSHRDAAGLEAAASQTRPLPSLPSVVPGCSWHGKWPLSHRSSWFLLFLSGINRPLLLCFIPLTASAPASCCAVCLCWSPGTMVGDCVYFSRNGRCLLFDKVNLSLGWQTYWEGNNPRLDCASGMKGRHFSLSSSRLFWAVWCPRVGRGGEVPHWREETPNL